MKKIIDRKVYDTDNAELVHYWSNGFSNSDFSFREKTLYRTAKGNWFVHHEGGGLTDMARSFGDCVGAGEDIVAMSAEEALAFLQKHNAVECVEKWFADSIEDA